jgi:hypothetical protein
VGLEQRSITQTRQHCDDGFAARGRSAAKKRDPARSSIGLKAAVENAIIPRLGCGEVRSRHGDRSAVAITKDEENELREQLGRLQQEHRDLDAAIAALAISPSSDLIQVQRLKKRKLVLRDKIRAVEDQITPDIIA